MQRWLIAGGLSAALLLGGWFLWVKPTGRPPPARASTKVIRLEVPIEKEQILATYENTFRCTVYYTPRESGFTSDGGFDLTPETNPGLGERKFPKDFLRAVELEGFGRLSQPAGGKSYIRYWSGKWGFAGQPLDNKQRPLIPRQTCAIAKPHALVAPNAKLSIRCVGLPMEFSNLRWRVADTGSGLEPRQLDLYWGEDDPLGPGKRLTKPKGFEGELLNPTIVVLADTPAR